MVLCTNNAKTRGWRYQYADHGSRRVIKNASVTDNAKHERNVRFGRYVKAPAISLDVLRHHGSSMTGKYSTTALSYDNTCLHHLGDLVVLSLP